jgi:peroxiredoxin Q/BCP
MVKIGDFAPDVCLVNQTDEEICLKDLKGKWVVLYFYPKDNTSGCTLEAKDFTYAVKEFEKLGAKIVGVSPDSTKSHQNFIAKHSLAINLLSDTDHKTLEKYGAWGKKKLYGREFFGVVRSTYLINPEGKIEYVWPKVKVKGHVDEVLMKLKELKDK